MGEFSSCWSNLHVRSTIASTLFAFNRECQHNVFTHTYSTYVWTLPQFGAVCDRLGYRETGYPLGLSPHMLAASCHTRIIYKYVVPASKCGRHTNSFARHYHQEELHQRRDHAQTKKRKKRSARSRFVFGTRLRVAVSRSQTIKGEVTGAQSANAAWLGNHWALWVMGALCVMRMRVEQCVRLLANKCLEFTVHMMMGWCDSISMFFGYPFKNIRYLHNELKFLSALNLKHIRMNI